MRENEAEMRARKEKHAKISINTHKFKSQHITHPKPAKEKGSTPSGEKGKVEMDWRSQFSSTPSTGKRAPSL